jgi:uncharacterized membrane protein YebE (DUF533 family)
MEYIWLSGAFMTVGILAGARHLVLAHFRKAQVTANFPLPHQRLIIAMASAANSDGALDTQELDTIHEMINRLSWRDYSLEEVRALVLAIKPVETPSQFRKLGKGLKETQRLAILKAAHAVAGADNTLNASEDGFLQRLADGLKLPKGQIDAIFARQPACP